MQKLHSTNIIKYKLNIIVVKIENKRLVIFILFIVAIYRDHNFFLICLIFYMMRKLGETMFYIFLINIYINK